MLQLILHVCLIINETSCKDVKLNFVEAIQTNQACFANGQFEAAKWINLHPNYKIKKIGCSHVDVTFANL